MYTLLLVDDDAEILELLALTLRGEGIRLALARTYEQAIRVIERSPVDAAVLDVQLTAADRFEGLTLLQNLRRLHPPAPAIVITGCGEPNLLARAYRLGAAYFMRKPLDVRELHYQLQLLGLPTGSRESSNTGTEPFIRTAWRLGVAL